jgi:DNA-directed RNA polymerase specialized sigma24 family protein
VRRDEEFSEFFTSRFDWARRTAYTLCGDWSEAGEIAQNAFVKAYTKWPSIRRETAEGYVRTIVTRVFLDSRRRGRDCERPVADLPEHGVGGQQPYDTWKPASSAPPPPGRPVAEIPLCGTRSHQGLDAEQLSTEFVSRLLELVPRELPEKTIGNAPGNSPGTVEFDVTDFQGTGSIRITGARFKGTPQSYADERLWETGDCEPARRLTAGDGTVMQLHSVRPFEPFQSLVQVLSVYRKDGLLVQLELRNFGSPDMTPGPEQPGSLRRTGAGRATLPLTEEQFARLGPAVAAVA